MEVVLPMLACMLQVSMPALVLRANALAHRIRMEKVRKQQDELYRALLERYAGPDSYQDREA